MNDEILEALRETIRKWAKISVGLEVDYGCKNCALCHIFILQFMDGRCGQCPISKKTDMFGCMGSAWDKWKIHQIRTHGPSYVKMHESPPHWIFFTQCPECRRLAQEELMFLQSLLEEYKEKGEIKPK